MMLQWAEQLLLEHPVLVQVAIFPILAVVQYAFGFMATFFTLVGLAALYSSTRLHVRREAFYNLMERRYKSLIEAARSQSASAQPSFGEAARSASASSFTAVLPSASSSTLPSLGSMPSSSSSLAFAGNRCVVLSRLL
jgi:hypothetical protein